MDRPDGGSMKAIERLKALEEAGIALDEVGAIKVDEFSKTAVDHIYAIGDVTERLNLTPVALAEAEAFANTVYRDKPTAMDYANVAAAVFSQPPIGSVGLTEDQARETFPIKDFGRRDCGFCGFPTFPTFARFEVAPIPVHCASTLLRPLLLAMLDTPAHSSSQPSPEFSPAQFSPPPSPVVFQS